MLIINDDMPDAINEGERVLRIYTRNWMDPLYTVADESMDIEEEIRLALRRKYGKHYPYEGYEDVSYLYDLKESTLEDAKSAWEGEGYYRIAWSDGGMDWTNDGPVWFGSVEELADELLNACTEETETHLAYAEKVKQFHQYELDALLGEFEDEYDVDAIIQEATRVCDDGNRYWVAEGDELTAIIESCEK